jgi:hypothetical protein
LANPANAGIHNVSIADDAAIDVQKLAPRNRTATQLITDTGDAGDIIRDSTNNLLALHNGTNALKAQDYFVISLKADNSGTDASGGAVADTVVQASACIPVAATVVAVDVSCATSNDTGCTADIFAGGGASVTSGAVTVAAAETNYPLTFSSAAVAANAVYTLRATVTNTKVVTGLHAQILCKAAQPAPVAYA